MNKNVLKDTSSVYKYIDTNSVSVGDLIKIGDKYFHIVEYNSDCTLTIKEVSLWWYIKHYTKLMINSIIKWWMICRS